MNIQWIEAAHHWDGREGYTPNYIILHGTAGFTRAEDVAAYFAQESTEASTNYVIGQDGTIIRCVAEEDAPWANGGVEPGCDPWWNTGINPNLITISIEHVKPHTDNSDELTDAQKQASFALVKDICSRWNIPRRSADGNGGITGHFSMQPQSRAHCPGPYPWDELWQYLLGQQQEGEEEDMIQIQDVANYFEDRGNGRWHCKNTNCDMLGALLDFWRKTGGVFRLPRTNEQYEIKDVVYQVCEAGIIVYDPGRHLDNPGVGRIGDCFGMHIDNEQGLQILNQHVGIPVPTPPPSQVDQKVIDALHALHTIGQQQESDAQSVVTTVQNILALLGK